MEAYIENRVAFRYFNRNTDVYILYWEYLGDYHNIADSNTPDIGFYRPEKIDKNRFSEIGYTFTCASGLCEYRSVHAQ